MFKENLKEEVSHGSPAFPLASYRWEGDTIYNVKLHWHKETELIYCEEGEFRVRVNMKEYNIVAPAFLFVSSGDIHSINLTKGQKESALVFDMKMLSFEQYDGIQYKIIRPLLDGKIHFPPIIQPTDGLWDIIKDLYLSMIENYNNNTLSSYLRVKAALYEMIANMYENGYFINEEEIVEADKNKIADIKRVLTYIHDHYNERIYIKDIADMISMNHQYFCRYFKKLMGKTVTEYMNEIRIEKASEYLLQTDNKIVDISMMCGYDHIGYFIKRFKEVKGKTPSEFRKSI